MTGESRSSSSRCKRGRRLRRWAVALAATPLLAMAQTPPERADSGDPAVVERPTPPPYPRSFGPGFGQRRGVTQEQWEKAAVFMEQHSPFRWRILQSLDEESGRKRLMKNLIWSQYNSMMESAANPEIRKLRVERIERDDASFQLAVTLRLEQSQQRPDTSKVEDLRRQLKDQTQRLVELGLEERRLRIKRLETALAAQKAGLAADEANQEKLAQHRTESLIRRADMFRSQAESFDAFMEELATPTTQPTAVK